MARLRAEHRRALALVLCPAILSPLLFFGKAEACMFCIFLLSSYWIFEVGPMAIVSLLPVFLFPIFSILPADVVCQNVFKDTTMVFFVTLMMALSVEECNLHRRIALSLLSRIGSRPHHLLFGFTVVTCFISFFVSDTATTALMVPIAVAVLGAMIEIGNSEKKVAPANQVTVEVTLDTNCREEKTALQKADDGEDAPLTTADRLQWSTISDEDKMICKALLYVCAHASLIGGTAILTSTGPNLIFRDNINSWYPEGQVEMSYLQWMAFAMPPLALYLLADYCLLTLYFLGPRYMLRSLKPPSPEDSRRSEAMAKSVRIQLDALGPISFAEKSVILFMALLVLSWVFREPGFMRGWGDLLPQHSMITDSCSGILIVFVLFLWPRHGFSAKVGDRVLTTRQRAETILTWSSVQRKFPWTVVFLMAAGFAISEAVKSSGLSSLIACQAVHRLSGLPPFLLQMLITGLVTCMTEFASNAATASIFVPIALHIAESLHLHPLYLSIPAAIAPSFSFLLPMSTPANAILFETGVTSIPEMAALGVLLDVACVLITSLNMNSWTHWIFHLDHYPAHIPIRNATSQFQC